VNQNLLEMSSSLQSAGYIIDDINGQLCIVDRSYSSACVDLMHAGCSTAAAAYWATNKMGEKWAKTNGLAQDRVKNPSKSGRTSSFKPRPSDW